MLAAPRALTSAIATLISLYMMRSSALGASDRIGRAGCRATSKHMRPSQRAELRIWKTTLACWKPQMDVTSTSIATACSTAILRS